MGTAPRARQHAAMPDPRRVVRSSFRLLRSIGMSPDQALTTIAEVARTVRARVAGAHRGQDQWLSRIIAIAEDALDPCAQSHPNRQENNDADRSSSTAGGQQTAKQPRQGQHGQGTRVTGREPDS